MSYKLYSFDKIPSTQLFAHQLIAEGKAAPRTVVLAQAQSAGRGRYQRTWVSHHGNLYASFIYSAPTRDPRLSYAVAVAVAETLLSFGVSCQIKWPNDILIAGKKVSGILIEYSREFAIVGIGINIKTNPTVQNYQTTKLDDYKPGISRDELLSALMSKLDWAMKLDFASVRMRWLELAASLNSEIIYKNQPAIFCGINDAGALVLRRGAEYITAWGGE
jgi:BirA family biotin operon repressor/biotin-[acetyl-CoA-carboxylase] ligase